MEAVYFGVPMLGFPVYGDQKHLAELVENSNMGLLSDMRIDPDFIQMQLQEIISEPYYKFVVEKSMQLLEFEESRSGKDAVYWFEYTAKFGTTHLDSPTHKLSFIALYDLDIKLFLTGLFIVGLNLLFYTC